MLLQEIIQNVNFSKVGSTDLKPMDISGAVVKEKLSFLLLSELQKDGLPPNLNRSTFLRLSEIDRFGTIDNKNRMYWGVKVGKKKYALTPIQHKRNLKDLSDPHCLVFDEIINPQDYDFPYDADPVFHEIKYGSSFEEISLFDATRKEKKISDSERIEELLMYFKIADTGIYTRFTVGSVFKPQNFPPLPKPSKNKGDIPKSEEQINAHIEDFKRFQSKLEKWFKGGFPRRYYCIEKEESKDPLVHAIKINRIINQKTPIKKLNLPSPVFYKPLGPMAYDLQPFNVFGQIRLHRLFSNPDNCGMHETLIPTILIHEGNYEYPVMTGLPNRKQVSLWNVDRIMKKTTDTVVICGCIQDAEALSRYNATSVENLVFTSFVDVGEKLELIDFSPLNGKNVVFLISNHNGKSLADAYIETDKVYRYLRGKTKLKSEKTRLVIPEFAFVQRRVEYPDSSSTIATPEELASVYYHNPPKIVPESTFPKFPLMGQSGFDTQLAKVLDPSSDSSVFVKDQKEIRKRRKKDPAKNAIIRSLLYHGEITLLTGYRGSGKSRFCQTLIRYIVNGNDKEFLRERFWTRCCKNSLMKIVYWCYDGVGPDELDEWRDQCVDGFSPEQKENTFIESTSRFKDGLHKDTGRPIFEAYKDKLKEYALKGMIGHPVDLLIIDTLTTFWGRDKISDPLLFLSGLTKEIPSMAVLVIHHTKKSGESLGGSAAEEIPRVVLSLKRHQIQDASDDSNDKDENIETFKMWFAKNNKVGIDIEKLPFICVRKSIDQYDVHKPVCSRKDMFDVLRYYYKTEYKLSDKAIGRLLGYTDRVFRNKENPIIDAETYNKKLKTIRENAPPKERSAE